MARIHNHLLICDLFNDTAERSDCLMTNMLLMSDEIKRGYYFVWLKSRRSRFRILMVSLEDFIDIILPGGLWYLGWLRL